MEKLIALVPVLAVLMMSGCTKSTLSPILHTVFKESVSQAEQFEIEAHPEAVPALRAATEGVCAVANGTNANSVTIVAALTAAGQTNRVVKSVVNFGISLLNTASTAVGTNNTTEIGLYAKDLCNGMRDGLPSPGLENRMIRAGTPSHLSSPNLPPHLK